MKFIDYEKESERTADPHEYELLNYGLGIAGEAGKKFKRWCMPVIKKEVFGQN